MLSDVDVIVLVVVVVLVVVAGCMIDCGATRTRPNAPARTNVITDRAMTVFPSATL
jgi:hypothetical protein